jgi:hypothetical protein
LALGSHAFKISFPLLAITDFEAGLLYCLKWPKEGKNRQKIGQNHQKTAENR